MPSRAQLSRDGDVGVITLSDPPLNLFTIELVNDLLASVEEAQGEMLRALVIRAEGKVFTGGVDVHFFENRTPDQASAFFGDLFKIVHALEDMPMPTLAVVKGLCLTAGLELSLGCDMIWAAESTQFGLVEAVVGLTPGVGGTQRIAERAGPARAREFVMSGGLYDAGTMERWNVVNRVLPDDQLEDKGMRFAQRLAAGPTHAHTATKKMVRAYLEHGPRGADERVPEIVSPLFDTADLQNGVQSFLEEGPGKAIFEGR